MQQFSEFYKIFSEAKVPVGKRRKIWKAMKKIREHRKYYNDVTFGFDIEFGPYIEEFFFEDIDFWDYHGTIMDFIESGYNNAREDWLNSEDRPDSDDLMSEWLEDNPEPEEEDFETEEAWESSHEDWETKKDLAESEFIEQCDEWEPSLAFDEWLSDNNRWRDYLSENQKRELYVEYTESCEQEHVETKTDNVHSELERYPFNFMRDIVESVDPDGKNVEVTTRILKRSDIPRFVELLEKLDHMGLPTGEEQSCHIHVGFPEEKSLIFYLSLLTVPDEETLENLIERSEDAMDSYAEWNKDVVRGSVLPILRAFYLYKDVYFSNEVFNIVYGIDGDSSKEWVQTAVEEGRYAKVSIKNDRMFLTRRQFHMFLSKTSMGSRHQGVNMTNEDHVEFRYPSSNIIDDPGLVLELLDYFSLISAIASKRRRVTFAQKQFPYAKFPEGIKRIHVLERNPDLFEIRFEK